VPKKHQPCFAGSYAEAGYPEGTLVRYWPMLPVRGPEDKPIITKTRSEAWRLGHGDLVQMVDGVSGGVSIHHLELIAHPGEPKLILSDSEARDSIAYLVECGYQPAVVAYLMTVQKGDPA
jgi:hypothetical protein